MLHAAILMENFTWNFVFFLRQREKKAWKWKLFCFTGCCSRGFTETYACCFFVRWNLAWASIIIVDMWCDVKQANNLHHCLSLVRRESEIKAHPAGGFRKATFLIVWFLEKWSFWLKLWVCVFACASVCACLEGVLGWRGLRRRLFLGEETY